MADESQSPIMAALMQVGAATEAQIASSGAALRDSLAGTNDALRQIINENYKVFEERTAELGEQHATLKQAGDENLSAVRAEISEAGAANAESFGAHQALITELGSKLEALQGELSAEKAERVAAEAEIKAAQAAAVSNMEADMQRKYEDMRDRHDNSNAKFTELIVEANEGMQSIVQRLESSSSEARVQVEAVQATLEEQHMALEQKLDVEIGKLTAAGQEAQEKLEETVRSECEALSADIDNACEDYQNLIAEVRRQLEIKFTETEIKIVGAEQKNASATSDTAAQLDAHSTQLNFLKNSLKTVEADGAKRRDELKTIVQGLIVANKGEQESRLETVDREMESIKAQLDTIQETLRTELQLTKASTEQKLESIMSATQRNLLGLKEDQAAQATAIESAKSKLESRLESLKNVHESTSQHLSNLAGKRNWVNDKEVDNCQCCDRRFSLTVRKHHCRMCGSIVCYNCSKWRRKIPGQTRLQRVCDSCIRNRSPSAADSDQFSQDLTGRDRESTDVLAGNGGAGDAGGGGGGGGDAEGDAAGVPTARLDLSS